MVAADLGIDGVALRRMNLITEAELPYKIGNLVPYETESAYDTGDYHATFDRCLAEIGWVDKQALQGALIDGRYHGLGFAPFVESGGAGPRENARLVVEDDGSVSIYVGSSALGQGIETVFAQIAGDALDLPMERLRVLHGSTTYVQEGFGTYHSRAVVMGGSAVLNGCHNLLEALRVAMRDRAGLPNAEIILSGGVLQAGEGRRLPLAAFAGTSALGTFANTHRTYSYGAHACHVAVDPKTGHVEIIDYVAVEDVGRAINPGIVHGQAIGAIVQGLGGVFLDHLVYDEDAQLTNASLADYLVPHRLRLPQRARRDAGIAAVLDQSAGCQGRRGGRDRLRGGRGRQCSGRGAGLARRAAAGPATVALRHLAPHPRGADPHHDLGNTMPVDVHAHYVPGSMMEQLDSRAAEFGISIVQHPPSCSCAIHFNYGLKVRPFFAKLIESVERRKDSMAAQGVDRQVLSMWADIFGYGLPDAQARAWHRFMNEHVGRLCLAHDRHFSLLASLPLGNPQDAAAELEYAVTQLGAVGAVVAANVEGVNLGELPLDPVWQTAVDLDVGVFIHPVQAQPQPRTAKFALSQIAQYTFDTTLCAGSLIFSGVLDRFPTLRLLLSHGGGTFPYLTGRFDVMHERMDRAGQHDVAEHAPSTYLRRFYYDTIVHDPSILRWLAERVSVDRVVLGSDDSFPPADRDPVGTVHRAGFTDAEAAKIMEHNPRGLFPRLAAGLSS